MSPALFAFIVPAMMAAFSCAFLLSARWVGQVAVHWAAGLLLAACGFMVPILPLPPVLLAMAANALFLGAALAYGQALLLQLGQAPRFRARAAFAALAYGIIVVAIHRGDLQAELVLGDLAWAVLLGWAVLCAAPGARRPLQWALLGAVTVMTLEALVRVLAISWLVSAGSGMEDYLSSNYAAFTQGTAGIILTAFCLTALGNLVETIITRFRQDAEQDPLTGLLNRRGLERAATSFNPRHRPVSVVQCDLDHFKRINDSYGHATGDQALQMVAALIQDLAPANSAVARFGGEEFVLLLDDTTLNQAGMLAHRMRLALGGLAWKHLGIEGQVTASFGVAQWSQSDHALADALARADVALYLAKDAGRNLVFLESWRPFQPSLPRVVQSA